MPVGGCLDPAHITWLKFSLVSRVAGCGKPMLFIRRPPAGRVSLPENGGPIPRIFCEVCWVPQTHTWFYPGGLTTLEPEILRRNRRSRAGTRQFPHLANRRRDMGHPPWW